MITVEETKSKFNRGKGNITYVGRIPEADRGTAQPPSTSDKTQDNFWTQERMEALASLDSPDFDFSRLAVNDNVNNTQKSDSDMNVPVNAKKGVEGGTMGIVFSDKLFREALLNDQRERNARSIGTKKGPIKKELTKDDYDLAR